VSRRTGISMATLRAWERRYEFPEAKRTAGGHRLFSERDVVRLHWVKQRIDEGMQTAQSISALRHQEQTGHLILSGNDLAQKANLNEAVREIELGENYFISYAYRLSEALSHRNTHHADEILGEVLSVCTPEELILKVISPVLAMVGVAWEQGEISVATEHLATNYLRHKLLLWMVSGPPPVSRPPIILSCAPNEWHEGSLLVIGALLRRRRWPVAYLGQAVPLADLATFVREIRPQLVVLVAMTEMAASGLVEWPNWLPEAAQSGKPVIGYGGLIYQEKPEWRSRMPGVYLGNTFEAGINSIEQLIA
jgi:MerR family transcriptional regulator, light-induced transcriptional regulator